MRREEKEEIQLDSVLDDMIMRVDDLHSTFLSMLHQVKYQYETINWPNFLDNFVLKSGHLACLSQILSDDEVPDTEKFASHPLNSNSEKAFHASEDWESQSKSRTIGTQTNDSICAQLLDLTVGDENFEAEPIQIIQTGVNPVGSDMMVGQLEQLQTPGQVHKDIFKL